MDLFHTAPLLHNIHTIGTERPDFVIGRELFAMWQCFPTFTQFSFRHLFFINLLFPSRDATTHDVCITSADDLQFFKSFLHFLPCVRAEEEGVAHRFHHLGETAERNGETEFVLADPRTHRRVKET